MKFKFLIIPTALMFHFSNAQVGTASVTTAQGTSTIPYSAASSTPVSDDGTTSMSAIPEASQTAIIDYKSVYEAASLEEEVKMATERFKLTPDQAEVWLTAATDRRNVEKQSREKLESKAANYEKDGIYRGLRAAQGTFYETITGYLTPSQKQAMELDRTILEEKRKRLAKMPPPPPPVVKDTVPVIDSTAIKSLDKNKAPAKKSKKKKQAVNP